MKRIFLTIALLLWSTTAFAEPQCNTQDNVAELLGRDKYQEFVAAAGVSTSGHLVEIYLNEETGTFSIVLTSPDKTSCLAVAGGGFRIKSEEQRKLEAFERIPKY